MMAVVVSIKLQQLMVSLDLLLLLLMMQLLLLLLLLLLVNYLDNLVRMVVVAYCYWWLRWQHEI